MAAIRLTKGELSYRTDFIELLKDSFHQHWAEGTELYGGERRADRERR